MTSELEEVALPPSFTNFQTANYRCREPENEPKAPGGPLHLVTRSRGPPSGQDVRSEVGRPPPDTDLEDGGFLLRGWRVARGVFPGDLEEAVVLTDPLQPRISATVHLSQ